MEGPEEPTTIQLKPLHNLLAADMKSKRSLHTMQAQPSRGFLTSESPLLMGDAPHSSPLTSLRPDEDVSLRPTRPSGRQPARVLRRLSLTGATDVGLPLLRSPIHISMLSEEVQLRAPAQYSTAPSYTPTRPYSGFQDGSTRHRFAAVL